MEKSPHTAKPIRCKAAVSRTAGEPLELEEIEVAFPIDWEVRIKILCTSICHSDVTFWKLEVINYHRWGLHLDHTDQTIPNHLIRCDQHHSFLPHLTTIYNWASFCCQIQAPIGVFPRIFGHEAVGVVESVGERVTEVKEGDTVIPVFISNCQECRDCESKKSNICSKVPFRFFPGMPRDGRSTFKDSEGEIIHNFLAISSFSEYTVVDVSHLVKIDAGFPPEKACLLSCGVTTGVGAVWKAAQVEEGTTVAIFGLGAVGLAVAEGARLHKASRIIGVDLSSEKFEIGKKFGVTDFINPAADCKDKNISEVIKEMTDGGADYCFECIGLASVMSDAFNSCRKGWGKTVILGVEKHGSPISFSSAEILWGRTFTGTSLGGIKPKSDIPVLIQRYMDKELHLDEFITDQMGFQDINKAFDLLTQGKSLRSILWMDP